jgi:hypothetical protein
MNTNKTKFSIPLVEEDNRKVIKEKSKFMEKQKEKSKEKEEKPLEKEKPGKDACKKGTRPKIDLNAINAVYGNSGNSEKGTALLENLGKMITGTKISIIKHQMSGLLTCSNKTPTITQSNRSTADVTDRSSTCNYNRLKVGLVQDYNSQSPLREIKLVEGSIADNRTVKSSKSNLMPSNTTNSKLTDSTLMNNRIHQENNLKLSQSYNTNNYNMLSEFSFFNNFNATANTERKVSSPNYEEDYGRFNSSPNIDAAKNLNKNKDFCMNQHMYKSNTEEKLQNHYINENSNYKNSNCKEDFKYKIKTQLNFKLNDMNMIKDESKKLSYEDFNIDSSFLDKLSYDDLLQSDELQAIPNISCLDFLKHKRLPDDIGNLDAIRTDSPNSYSDFFNNDKN